MVGVQIVLLKVALDNRPGWRGDGVVPFGAEKSRGNRPWGFWRWKSQRLYVDG